MNVLLTGCAGFIGSNLIDYMIKNNFHVVGIDNLSTGKIEHISNHIDKSNFVFHNLDLKDKDKLDKVDCKDVDLIIHLAANADVRFGLEHPSKDLEENTIVTFNVLELARNNNIKQFAFSSTGSIYGEPELIPTPENAPFPVQTSLYGASKLACEGLIQAYAEGYGMRAFIFRFVSIMGPRYSHGHVYDFYKQLLQDPSRLHLLGDGNQRKSYLHVTDCISAIFTVIEKAKDNINIYNLGVDDTCTVKQSANWISDYLSISPTLTFEGGERGWVGDNPYIHLSIKKLKSLGWVNQYSIEESVKDTVKYIENNKWILQD
jgi:UDP-glucose 4-epimerase